MAVTVPLYAIWAAFLATGGGDLAAQLAWAGFVSRSPSSAYNLFWYGGMHTVNYSVISPQLMALFGVRTVGVLAGLASSWLVGVLMVRAGVRRPLWPALFAALALWCDVVSGRTTFALGTAFALASCLVLAGGARKLVAAAVLAALATLASPVAGLFLVVAGAGWFLARDWHRASVLLLPPVVMVATTTLLFPFQGEQPMSLGRVWQPSCLALAVVLFAPRAWRVLRNAAAVYAVGIVLTYLIPSPIGTNVERLAELAAPAALLACALQPAPRRLRSLVSIGAAVSFAISSGWVIKKTADDITISTEVPAWASHTDGVVRELAALRADRTRVEVVPARNHREAAVLSSHVNTARGWNRQLDVERGRLFYDGTLSEASYRDWLNHWAVGYVVLHDGRPDGPAEQEAALVRSGPGWLDPVWHDSHWSIYRVRNAPALVTGPAQVVTSDGSEVVIRARREGPITVRIVFSSWLHADGGACLKRAGDWVQLTAPAAGTYRLSSEYRLPWTNGC
ncbi:hypothetical protein AB0M87_11275 [Streptomyces sp. NPDC051320]|uniref:hypothetical protein n=1 Tax=Streptomyces sp. NPDC051320 TaxID=3154644 RepID=UPI0034346127